MRLNIQRDIHCIEKVRVEGFGLHAVVRVMLIGHGHGTIEPVVVQDGCSPTFANTADQRKRWLSSI